MEQQTESSTLAEHAESLLLKGQVREAADEYARVATLDPNGPVGHLGVAESHLALGQYGMAYAAARHVQQIAPQSAEAAVARAILALLDRRYEAVLIELDKAATALPGNPYIHAMRGYAYRRLGNSYDASLAESKAARLSGTRDLGELFPKVEQLPAQPDGGGQATPPIASPYEGQGVAGRVSYQQQRPWSQRSQLERQMVRARFATRGPVVTYTLIAINVAVFLIGLVSVSLQNTLFQLGAEQGSIMLADPVQFYRVITAMFLHLGFAHIALNMISLLSVGIITEQIFGHGRFLAIYFIGGIAGGLAQALLVPNEAAVGASGAIFAIFGAFGAFVLLRRRSLGPSANGIIGQWLFFLVINLIFSFTAQNIGAYDHVGGLVVGFLMGALFVSISPRGRSAL